MDIELDVWNQDWLESQFCLLLCDCGQYFEFLGYSVSLIVQWDTNDPHFIGLEVIN